MMCFGIFKNPKPKQTQTKRKAKILQQLYQYKTFVGHFFQKQLTNRNQRLANVMILPTLINYFSAEQCRNQKMSKKANGFDKKHYIYLWDTSGKMEILFGGVFEKC